MTCGHKWADNGPGWVVCEICGEAITKRGLRRWAVSGMDGVRFLSWNDAHSAARRTGGDVWAIW